ncbi:integrase core domain-containing protein [Kaistella antarctica]|uniref:integrase core domain-containing protein n=1 Tax=Kaistella antarctica TaxID=266748 RepID=UPI0035D120AF
MFLNAYIFENLDDVRSVTQQWVTDYNHERPHDSPGGLSPVMWKNRQQAIAKASAFPDHLPTTDNNRIELSRKDSIFEPYLKLGLYRFISKFFCWILSCVMFLLKEKVNNKTTKCNNFILI